MCIPPPQGRRLTNQQSQSREERETAGERGRRRRKRQIMIISGSLQKKEKEEKAPCGFPLGRNGPWKWSHIFIHRTFSFLYISYVFWVNIFEVLPLCHGTFFKWEMGGGMSWTIKRGTEKEAIRQWKKGGEKGEEEGPLLAVWKEEEEEEEVSTLAFIRQFFVHCCPRPTTHSYRKQKKLFSVVEKS